jgi:23S rRNA pseudouridine2605 synthase
MAYSGRSGGSGKRDGRKSAGGGKGKFSGERKSSGGSSYGKKSSSRTGDRSFGDKPTWKKSGAKSFGDKPAFKRRSDDGDDKPAFRKKSFGDKPFGDKPAFKRRRDDGDDKPAFRKKSFGDKPFGDKPAFKRRRDDGDEKPSFKRRRDDGDDKPAFRKKSFGDKPFGDKPAFKRRRDDGDEKPAFKRRRDDGDDKPVFRKKSFGDKPFGDKPAFKRRRDDGDDKPAFKRRSDDRDDKPAFRKKSFGDKPSWKKDGSRSFRSTDENSGEWEVFESKDDAKNFREKHTGKKHRGSESEDGTIRLNKYVANTGLCSRREADELIESGVIKVNGKIVTELGTKISPSDTVHYGDQLLRREKQVYILLNKPKDYITTTDDPQERKTVLDLIEGACEERVYPVGRLDRNTTGVLLLTNDGDLAERLMHPKYGVEKIYQVNLDMNLRKEDFDKILEGVELEDGFIKADDISFVGDSRKDVGIVLHSGRNRIVRRLFEHLGYEVVHLDRVSYAGLTKKNISKGRWRMLEPKEIGFLKMKVGGEKKATRMASSVGKRKA